MHRRLVLCALVLTALSTTGCAARAPSAPPSAPQPLGGWTRVVGRRYTAMVPTSIAGFTWTGYRVDYPNPALGTMLHYRAIDSLAADLYVYPSPVDGDRCRAACADSVAELVANDFALFFTLTQLRTFDSAVVMQPERLVPAEGERWLTGRVVRIRGTRRRRATASDFYLFLPRLHNVKVRATYTLTPDASARVEAFARAAAAGVTLSGMPAPPIACPEGTYTGPTQGVAVTLGMRPDTVFAVVRRTVATLGYVVQRADTARWFLVTEPRFTVPPAADSAGPSPLRAPRGESGVRVIVRLTASAGDSTRLQVDGAGLCNVGAESGAQGAAALRDLFRSAAEDVLRRIVQHFPAVER